MSWFPFRRARRQRKALLDELYPFVPAGQHPRARPWSVERAVRDGVERSVWTYRAVDTISTHAARLPVRVRPLAQVDESPRPPLPDHPLYAVLNRRANSLEQAWVFRKRLSMQLLLSKRGAFVETARSRGGDLVRLALLPPGRTRPVPGRDGGLDSFETTDVNGRVRRLEPEQVRWIRSPHVLDPYSGMTALEAAGLSVDLDHFARLYNVAFLTNDRRPGGIVSVDGDMDEDDLRKLSDRFQAGPNAAGAWTFLAGGSVSVADTSAKPRELGYEQVASMAKVEILAAFGVPESQIGNAAGRTFANAEAEAFSFWTITMTAHLDMLAKGFGDDVEEGLEPYVDTSSVEVLRKPLSDRLKEARQEVTAGLRTPYSYAQLAGYGEELAGDPAARRLRLPANGTTEQRTAGSATTNPAPTTPPNPGDDPGDDPATPADRSPRTPQEPARTTGPATPRRPTVSIPARSRPIAARKVAGPGERIGRQLSLAVEAEQQAVTTLTAVTHAVAVRGVERTIARLCSPRARRGTRHWDARGGEVAVTAVLDGERIADPGTWQREVEQAVMPALEQVAAQVIADLFAQATGARKVLPEQVGVGPHAREAARALAERVGAWAVGLATLIGRLDGAGEDIEAIIQAIRQQARTVVAQVGQWVRAAVATVIDTVCHGAAEVLSGRGVQLARRWVCRLDERVRASHADAHGQIRLVGQLFELEAGARLRWPRDPDGPLAETAGCRCRLAWHVLPVGERDLTEA